MQAVSCQCEASWGIKNVYGESKVDCFSYGEQVHLGDVPCREKKDADQAEAHRRLLDAWQAPDPTSAPLSASWWTLLCPFSSPQMQPCCNACCLSGTPTYRLSAATQTRTCMPSWAY